MKAHDEQRPDPRAQAVQRIVADLLGEADAAERAQIAADLAADPTLAAERARLEATIGLVRDSMADARPETLSPEAAARLAAAAERGRPTLAGPGSARRGWRASPVFLAAASVTVALGVFALWPDPRMRMGVPVETADAKRQRGQLEDALQAAHEEQESNDVADLAMEVRDEPEKNATSSLEQGVPAAAPAPQEQSSLADAPSRFDETGKDELDAGLLKELAGLGYAGGSSPSSAPTVEGAPTVEEQLGVARARLTGSPVQPPPATEAVTAGTYRGAGDSVPLGGERFGMPTPAESAPADAAIRGAKLRHDALSSVAARDAAPASPGAGGTVTGTDEFFLGRGERKNEAAPSDGDDRFALQRQLRELGYGDEQLGTDRVRRIEPSDYEGKSFSDRIAPMTPEERARSIEVLLADCRRRPSEHPRDMFYRWWGDNPFEYARTDPLSTFAVDVDTASYTLARRYLVDGILPTKQQIRTEEFLNYFKGDVPAPTEETFAVATELAPSPFQTGGDAWTLRVALRGREVTRAERQPLALTFVVDVSGSMKEQNRLELVKHALRLLVGELDARDSIAIVAFSNEARLVLPKTSARLRDLIESALFPLAPQGGTNVQGGLRMGYEAALAGLDTEAHNRVVLLSDGVGNIGETDALALTAEVEHARERGLWLNTVGVGMGNHNDAFLEQLADKGDGVCNYIDDAREARRALVENFTGAFEPIARDVKIQVEFDPAQIERYRLLGYENRAVADADFRNDAVDAGEIGAGHQVVALYEVVRSGAGDGPLATVRVRWRPAGTATAGRVEEDPAREAAWTVDGARAAGSFAAASPGFRRSVLVGQLAEVLRRSIHARDDSLESLLAEARTLVPVLNDPDFEEFVSMVERTIELIAADWGRYDDLARRLDRLRMQNYLKAKLEDVARDLDRARIEELDGQIRDLEAEIRRELEREPERFPKSKVR